MAAPSPLAPPAHHLTLRDGRRLAYSLLGAPWPGQGSSSAGAGVAAEAADGAAAAEQQGARAPGRPLLYIHGFCSSRLEAGLLHPHAKRHAVPVLALDRPGAGERCAQCCSSWPP